MAALGGCVQGRQHGHGVATLAGVQGRHWVVGVQGWHLLIQDGRATRGIPGGWGAGCRGGIGYVAVCCASGAARTLGTLLCRQAQRPAD